MKAVSPGDAMTVQFRRSEVEGKCNRPGAKHADFLCRLSSLSPSIEHWAQL